MDRLDLPDIRARLTVRERGRRGRKGPLQSLRSAFAPEPQRPLLGPVGEPPLGPNPRMAPAEASDPFNGTVEWASRRATFGQRPAQVLEDFAEPLLLVDDGAHADVAPPSPISTSPSEQIELSFLAPQVDLRARALLERLELRLVEEQVGLIRRISLCCQS
jgi:hypothetical protein